MSFQWPIMLVFLLLVPLAVYFYARLQERRRQMAEHFGSLGFSQGPGGKTPGFIRHLPPALFLTGLTILIVSLARPHMTYGMPVVEGTVMLVIDVSGSMAADDMEPSRMGAAKAAAQAFVQRQPATVKIGVAAFSDGGLAVQAPTNDQNDILAAINRLTPQRGTSVGTGIITALKAIAVSLGNDLELQPMPSADGLPIQELPPPETLQGSFASTAILLFSDGENNDMPDPFETSQVAADMGVRIYTVGVGSPVGTILEVEGFSVHTRLDEAALQQIAQISGGEYYFAGNDEDLRRIYDNLELQLVVNEEEMEATSLFASASIFFLLTGGLFSLFWFRRLP